MERESVGTDAIPKSVVLYFFHSKLLQNKSTSFSVVRSMLLGMRAMIESHCATLKSGSSMRSRTTSVPSTVVLAVMTKSSARRLGEYMVVPLEGQTFSERITLVCRVPYPYM